MKGTFSLGLSAMILATAISATFIQGASADGCNSRGRGWGNNANWNNGNNGNWNNRWNNGNGNGNKAFQKQLKQQRKLQRAYQRQAYQQALGNQNLQYAPYGSNLGTANPYGINVNNGYGNPYGYNPYVNTSVAGNLMQGLLGRF